MFNSTNEMNIIQEAINQHAPKYIDSYTQRFGKPPLHWFGFPYWFRNKTGLKMTPEDVEYSIKVIFAIL